MISLNERKRIHQAHIDRHRRDAEAAKRNAEAYASDGNHEEAAVWRSSMQWSLDQAAALERITIR